MASKPRRKSTGTKAAAEAFEQAMLAEGAPVALDLLRLGSSIADLVRGRPRKTTAKRRKPKKSRGKAGTTRAKKKSATRKRSAARKTRRRA
jgi:hypothetical protein